MYSNRFAVLASGGGLLVVLALVIVMLSSPAAVMADGGGGTTPPLPSPGDTTGGNDCIGDEPGDPDGTYELSTWEVIVTTADILL